MPIKFRCQHCTQLLGIARRKAGTPVTCPTCHNQVLVPQADELAHGTESVPAPDAAPVAAPPVAAPPGPAPAPLLFERDDFDDLLQPGAPSMRIPAPHSARPFPPPVPAPSTGYDPASTGYNADSPPPAPTVGLVLSPARTTVLTVVMIVLLAVAFGSGLLVGRYAF